MLRRLTTRLYDNAYLLLSFMALCWAGNQVLGRAVAGHIPPIAYSFLRWSLATVIVLPFALPHVRRDWPVIRTRWRYLATGICCCWLAWRPTASIPLCSETAQRSTG